MLVRPHAGNQTPPFVSVWWDLFSLTCSSCNTNATRHRNWCYLLVDGHIAYQTCLCVLYVVLKQCGILDMHCDMWNNSICHSCCARTTMHIRWSRSQERTRTCVLIDVQRAGPARPAARSDRARPARGGPRRATGRPGRTTTVLRAEGAAHGPARGPFSRAVPPVQPDRAGPAHSPTSISCLNLPVFF